MSVLFYIPHSNGRTPRLRGVIERLASETKGEVYRRFDDLFHRLSHPMGEQTTALLVADTREDLSDLVSIGELLEDVRILLIVPDREPDTLSE